MVCRCGTRTRHCPQHRWSGGVGRDDIFYYAVRTLRTCARTSTRYTDASVYWNLLVSSARRYVARPTLTAVTVIVYIGPHSCVQSERSVRQLRNSVWKRQFCFCVSADPIVLSAFFPSHISSPPSVPTTLSVSHRRFCTVFFSHVHQHHLSLSHQQFYKHCFK